MSIGEYYKLLMEGKRPTRLRTHKDEPVKTADQQKQELEQKKLKKDLQDVQEATNEKSNEKIVAPTDQEKEKKRKEKMERKIKQKHAAEEVKKPKKQIGVSGKTIHHELKSLIVKERIETQHIKQKDSKKALIVASGAVDIHQKIKNLAPKEIKVYKKDTPSSDHIDKFREENKVIDKLESVFPHPAYTKNRVCLISNDDTQILGNVVEYDEYRFKVIIEENKELNQEIQPTSVREELVSILGKPFLCKISYLSEIPIPLMENIKNEKILISNNFKDQGQIVVCQLIDQSMQQHPLPSTQDDHQDSQIHLNNSQDVHSHHHSSTHAPRKFITFCISNQNQNKQAIPTVQIVNLQFKENFNPQKDLKEFDEKEFKEDQENYNKQFYDYQVETAQQLQTAYQQFMINVSSIPMTQDNMEDLMFTICTYEAITDNSGVDDRVGQLSSKARKGIFVRIKYDKYHQDYMLMFKYIQFKANQKERIEWIQLSKFKIRADLQRGYVSLNYIQNLDNMPVYTTKFKLRHIQMVSYFEIQKQKQALRKYYQEDGEEVRKAIISKENNKDRCVTCNYITQEIEHLKCSNCQHVYHEQCLHQQFQSCLGIRESNWRCPECVRCTHCLSMKNKGQMFICRCCNSPYHIECLDQSVKHSIPSIQIEKSIENSVTMQLSNNANKPGMIGGKQMVEIEFKCEHCVFCENCGTKEAGKNRLNKWSKDFKLCSTCNKKKKNKQFCPICERFWPDPSENTKIQPLQAAVLVLEHQNQTQFIDDDQSILMLDPEQQLKLQKIQCSSCNMVIHTSCDRMFQDTCLRKKFEDLKLQYNCPQCRQQARILLIQSLVEKLSEEDKNYYFQEPVEEHVPNYTRVVKNPMCFKYVRQKLSQQIYLRCPEQLRSDCTLIFNNAILFNLPKTKVHKEAAKMNDYCSQMIQSIWSTLERNKNRTLDEDLYQNKIKNEVKQLKITGQGGQIPQMSQQNYLNNNVGDISHDIQMNQNQDQDYIMKVEDLFEMAEHTPQQKLFGANPEKENEISDYHGEDDSADFDVGTNSVIGAQSNIVAQKNLRTRKNINYNEDKMLQSSDSASLAGSKRALKLDDDTMSLQRGQSQAILGLNKRQKTGLSTFGGVASGTDLDFNVPFQHQKSFNIHSGIDLLNMALNQQKQQELQTQQLNEKIQDGLSGQVGQGGDNTQGQVNIVQQQQQMMMNYYQDMDDEKCYYSNPTRCSFDDPLLMFEEMCYLCGAFGNKEDFLSCTLCGESFHTYCLTLPHDDISKFQPYWKCLNCKFCEICASATQEAFLLYCDVCDKAFHSFCLKPKLKMIPNCGWKCQECFSCQRCGSKQFFSIEDSEQNKNLEVTDYQFSKNFSFCYQCGINEYKKSFCNICKQKSEEFYDNQQSHEKSIEEYKKSLRTSFNSNDKKQKMKSSPNMMLKCYTCGFYSHIKCSRLTPETLDEIQIEMANQNAYKCLDCILNGKTINHLIRETCDHYENIHQIISRQKLLSQICQEILQKYFPIQEKAPLFIKSFIDQNQEFFKQDEVIQDWFNLLETNVCFENDEMMSLGANENNENNKDEEMQDEEENEQKLINTSSKQANKKLNIIERELKRDLDSQFHQSTNINNFILHPHQLYIGELTEVLFNDKEDEDLDQTTFSKQIPLWQANKKTLISHEIVINEDLIILDNFGTENDIKKILRADEANHLISHSKFLIKQNRVHNIEQNQNRWDDLKFDNVQGKSIKAIRDPTQGGQQEQQKKGQPNQTQKIITEMFSHKQGFLPEKRNLYKSLYYGNIHRFGQKDLFVKPEEIAHMITIPTEENLQKINFPELYVKIEFKAVMKIKFQFFKWFEDLIKSIIKNNQKFLRKEKRRQMFRQEENSKNSADDIQMIGNETYQNELGANSSNLLQNNNNFIALIEDQQNAISLEEDILINNPQQRLHCVLCRLNGEYKITGRLIPYQVNQFVHTNCAFWSTDVHETDDGQLVNFFFVQAHKAKFTKCTFCGEFGASLICFTKKCHNTFHFPCAYRHNKIAFLRTKETYCDTCCKQKDMRAGYLKEFNTNRRLYIVKNHQPWNTSQAYGNFPPTNNGGQTQNLSVSGPDSEKPFQIEKWRPYYYDMFNRVGNLTVLSLRKEINQIVEESMGHKGISAQSLNPLNDLTTATDFSTIRVYWKFYYDHKLEIEDENSMNPMKMRKSYFLYFNNTIREVTKNDLHYILSYASEKIKEKSHYHNMHLTNLSAVSSVEIVQHNQASNNFQFNPLLYVDFWQKIIQHFQKERPNFSLQNIEFSIQEFAGKTKYPISIWNRAEVKNKNFFLKSGYQVLASLNADERDFSGNVIQNKSEGQNIDDIFKNMIKINQCGENQTGSSYKRYHPSKHLNYEDLLQLLGKKYFFLKNQQEERKQQNDQQQQQQKSAQAKLNKKLRITDTIDTNKEIDLPIAMKYRLSKTQPKRVDVGPSKIHRNGLFTFEDLMPGDIVIEYVGEKIRNKVADKREEVYNQKGVGDCYLFRLDREYIIDATFYGNKARYLNHSCDANCSAKIINVQGQKHIIISANRQIKCGEELTYNYNFDIEADKLECYCGAPTCLGRLN